MHRAYVEFPTPKTLREGTVSILIPDLDANELQERIDSGESLYLVRKPNGRN